MVTLKDVARKSGFAATTVSFVLNDAPLAKYIAAETKQRIRNAAKELRYRPNQFARTLRSNRSYTVGVVVFDLSDPYCTEIARGVANGFDRLGAYLPILVDVRNNHARFVRSVAMLIDRQVEGLIILGNSIYPEKNLRETLQECRIPIVIIGRELESDAVSSVTADNERGAGALIEHLHALGHRKIAFIRGPRPFIDSSQRWKGIQSYAKAAGLKLNKHLIADLDLRNAGHEGGYELTRRLLETGEPFTAVMAYDDLTAFGAIRALREAGKDVPKDCSVVGFDDVPMSAFYNPPLTTIHQDMEQQGALGVEILFEAIKLAGNGDAATPVKRSIVSTLSIRSSTAPPGKVR